MALLLTGLWRSVHIDDLRRSTIMVSDVTKLQEVAISQLFLPDDTAERESQGKVFGDAGWQERRPGRARCYEDRATVLLSPVSPRPCLSAAVWPVSAQLPDGDTQGGASCSRRLRGRQCLHLDTGVGGCVARRPECLWHVAASAASVPASAVGAQDGSEGLPLHNPQVG